MDTASSYPHKAALAGLGSHHTHLSLQSDPSETENAEPLQQKADDPGDKSQGSESHPAPHFWDQPRVLLQKNRGPRAMRGDRSPSYLRLPLFLVGCWDCMTHCPYPRRAGDDAFGCWSAIYCGSCHAGGAVDSVRLALLTDYPV